MSGEPFELDKHRAVAAPDLDQRRIVDDSRTQLSDVRGLSAGADAAPLVQSLGSVVLRVVRGKTHPSIIPSAFQTVNV
jgi:hypothetical protein